jgi:hypothetical protein
LWLNAMHDQSRDKCDFCGKDIRFESFESLFAVGLEKKLSGAPVDVVAADPVAVGAVGVVEVDGLPKFENKLGARREARLNTLDMQCGTATNQLWYWMWLR